MKTILKLILCININIVNGQQNSSLNNINQLNSTSNNDNTPTNISVDCTKQISFVSCISEIIKASNSTNNNTIRLCCWETTYQNDSVDSSCITNTYKNYNNSYPIIKTETYGNGRIVSTYCKASQIKIFFECNFIIILGIILIIGK